MIGFQDIHSVPLHINLARLDDGTGIANTLVTNSARYHKSCYTACNSRMLDRAGDQRQRKISNQLEGNQASGEPSPKKTRSSLDCAVTEDECILCSGKYDGLLIRATSDDIDVNLKQWAHTTHNYQLVAKLDGAKEQDLHSMNARYHKGCYTKLYTQARAINTHSSQQHCSNTQSESLDAIAIAQLVAYLDAFKDNIHKLSDLVTLYTQRLEQLGGQMTAKIHATRFKERLIGLLPEWKATPEGREVYLSHKKTLGSVLANAAHKPLQDSEAVTLVNATVILRRYILEDQSPFNGIFPPNCLQAPIPDPLVAFINMTLQGPSIKDQVSTETGARYKVACAISQLLIHNAVKHTPSSPKDKMRHPKTRETPLPLYIGLKLHADDRLRRVIDTFHKLGLPVSYDRVCEVKLDMTRSVCKRFQEDGVVVPTNMRKHVFTTGDLDNIDSSKSSNMARSELHGTLMTLTNHLSLDNQGVIRDPCIIDHTDTSVPELPASYTVVPPVELYAGDIILAKSLATVRPGRECIPGAIVKEQAWLETCTRLLEKDALDDRDTLTWAGFNSSLQSNEVVKPRAEIGMLPIFPEKAPTASMVKHGLTVIKDAIEFLNPGQTPVAGGDQPIFALGKQVQWRWPDELGEDKYVLMMGGLHIEMAAQSMMGKMLKGSGWVQVLTEAGVLTSGRATSALADHYVKRTRYAHHVTLVACYVLRNEAYQESLQEELGDGVLSFDEWCKWASDQFPMFWYWSTVMELELLNCRLVRSQREGQWLLYVQVLDELCPWFFVFDHTNYSRWLPIHVRDMVQLPNTHPDVYNEFMKGNFVVQRSEHKFSLIAKDQSHEQTNKVIKGHGGATGLFDDPSSLMNLMLSGPEMSRAIEQFEISAFPTHVSSKSHHEEAHTYQVSFAKDVQSLIQVMKSKGNPFSETSPNLIALDTQEVMDDLVVHCLKQAHTLGTATHQQYVSTRIVNANIAITDTLKRLGIYTFANQPDHSSPKNNKMGTMRRNTTLITQLFLSLQSRPDADISDFFKFENQRDPPSLSDRGQLRAGSKSDILKCFQVGSNPQAIGSARNIVDVTVKVLDGPAIVHMVRPTRAKTFDEYASIHFVPFIKSHLGGQVTRVDIVWDVYLEQSLKGQTQRRRGTGTRTRVTGKTPIPKKDWNQFLKNADNKEELFDILSKAVTDIHDGDKQVISTNKDTVLTNHQIDVSALKPCNHQEADTRMLLHLKHAASQGHRKAFLKTVDSDVVVLAITNFNRLSLDELWVVLGTGTNIKNFPIHEIVQQLNPEKLDTLHLFHAFTGCDTTSKFLGVGKKTAWAVWDIYPDITNTWVALATNPAELKLDTVHMARIERFVVLLYSKTCGAGSVNEARKLLFTHGCRSLETIPPTQAALFQHMKRVLFQASFVWDQSLQCHQDLPDPSEWGWQRNEKGQWVPFWTDLADASKACSVLLRCGCIKACQGNCKCHRAHIRCSPVCKCEGGCCNNDDNNDDTT
ncbi:MAG: hypothetical protein ABW185_15180 [Sedimenticola sp.]